MAVAGRDTGQVDQRIAMSSLQWKTDSPIAALALVKAGLGWAQLPASQVREAVQGGELGEIPTANLTDVLRFFVDIVWTEERPPGMAATRFIELLNAHQM